LPLDAEHKRQIAQFIVVVAYYLDLALPARRETDVTFEMTKLHYVPGATATARTRELTIISGNLSSAAIRLASIDDVLKIAGVSRKSYNECRSYFKGGGTLSDSDGQQRFDAWFHVMLRDGAAHEEPPIAPKAKDAASSKKTSEANLHREDDVC